MQCRICVSGQGSYIQVLGEVSEKNGTVPCPKPKELGCRTLNTNSNTLRILRICVQGQGVYIKVFWVQKELGNGEVSEKNGTVPCPKPKELECRTANPKYKF